MRKAILLFFIGTTIWGCLKEPGVSIDTILEETIINASADGTKNYFILRNSNDYVYIPQDPKNPLSENKVRLGKMLFHESGLGINPEKDIHKNTYSCASCHFAGAGFQAGRFQGLGEGAIGFGHNGESREIGPLVNDDEVDAQPIKSPSILNTAYQKNMLWNGQFGATGANEGRDDLFTPDTPKEINKLGFEGVESQAIAGLEVHRLDMTKELAIELGYQTLFDYSFPEIPESERYNKVTAGLAIAAFERTVLSNEAPFQKWLRGHELAMSNSEKNGAILFFGKAECNNCHTGPALSQEAFYAIGLKDLFDCPEEVHKTDPMQAEHLGRGGFTGEESDNYKFKVPQLYNLADSPFYGHGSSLRSIEEVINYKNNAIPENQIVRPSHLAAEFHPLGLTENEKADLVSFIKTGLHDPNLIRYQPERVHSNGCIPVNDPIGRIQLGCD